MFEALGRLIYRYRWLTLILAGIFLLLSVGMLVHGGDLSNGTIYGIESDRAGVLASNVLHHPPDTTVVVVFGSDSLDPDGDAFRAAMRDAVAPLRNDPHVVDVLLPEDTPEQQREGMVNVKRHMAFALVSLTGDMKTAIHVYPGVRRQLHSDRLTITCTGYVPFIVDLNSTLAHDLAIAELISLPLALLVLLVVFGSFVAATLPVGVGGLAVAGGIAIVMLISRRADIAQYTVNVCSLIGLGVAIDYSLFIVSRYREELAAGHDYPDALARALATAGRVVAFSGLVVGTGLCGLLFFEDSYLWPMGLGGAIVVALSIVFALTFLPAILAVLGPKIHAGRVTLPTRMTGQGRWHRMAMWVMRRPIQILVPTLALLLAMGIPFRRIAVTTVDVRILTGPVEASRGYDLLREAFPDESDTRILIAIHFPTSPALTEKRVGPVYDFAHRIAKIPHVRKVMGITGNITVTRDAQGKPILDDSGPGKALLKLTLFSPPDDPESRLALDTAKKYLMGDDVLLMYAITDLPPETEAARDVVRAIRAERQVGDGTILVGGQTAQDVDTTKYMLERVPRAVGFVVGVTTFLLFMLLGSVVLPIKAVIMNFVSIAGSFGALVWVFQDAHLFVHHPRPLEPSLPILMFCVLFGLSMDYEVLMLSRIKESYERSGDNTSAVAEGLEKTAGLITSAALIMVAVFSAFVMANVVVLQAVGFGLALAVALDATLVRVLLVPATMRLFGHLNWWAPAPLTKLRGMIAWRGRHVVLLALLFLAGGVLALSGHQV